MRVEGTYALPENMMLLDQNVSCGELRTFCARRGMLYSKGKELIEYCKQSSEQAAQVFCSAFDEVLM